MLLLLYYKMKEPCNMQGQQKETQNLHIYCSSYLVFNRCVLSKLILIFIFCTGWLAPFSSARNFKIGLDITNIVVEVHCLILPLSRWFCFNWFCFFVSQFVWRLDVKVSAKMIMNYNSRLRRRPKKNVTHFGVELEKQTDIDMPVFFSTFPNILRQSLEKFYICLISDYPCKCHCWINS